MKYFAYTLLFLFSSSHSFAATVDKKYKKERIRISAGSSSSLAKGEKICSFDNKGVQLVCGTIYKIKDKTAFVQMASKEDYAKVAKGQTVKVEKEGKMVDIGASPTAPAAETATVPTPTVPQVEPVTLVKKLKKNRFRANAGTLRGSSKGSKVCSYDKKWVLQACGIVYKLNKSGSLVQVGSNEDFAKLAKGQALKIEKDGAMIDFATPGLAAVEVPIMPATITKLYKKQRLRINAGSIQGLGKKQTICFFDEKDVQQACGTVFKVKEKKAFVKVKEATDFAKAILGLKVKLKEGESFRLIKIPGEIPTLSGSDDNILIRLGYAPGLALPVKYNAVDVDGSDFTANTPTTFALLGVQMNLEYFFSESLSLGLGVRYRSVPVDQVRAGANTVYKESSTDMTSVAGILDLYFYTAKLWVLDIRFGSGLSYDSSTVNFVVNDIDEDANTETSFYEAKSSLGVGSLRLLMDTRFDLWVLNFGLGLELEAPLFDSGATISGSTDTSLDETFQETLEHTSSGGAFGVVLDIGYKF